jgi:hypothetical protein
VRGEVLSLERFRAGELCNSTVVLRLHVLLYSIYPRTPRRSLGMHRILIATLLLAGTACSQANESGAAAPPPSTARPAVGADLRYKSASGEVLLRLEPRDGGFKLEDGTGRLLGKVKVSEDRVKLKDAADVETAKVKRKPDGAEIEDASGQRLFRIQSKGDGDWKLEDGSGVLVARCKSKENGFEVRKADGSTLAKVKVREGKLVFDAEDGTRLASLDGTTDPRAGMWLAVDALPLPQRGALFVFFQGVWR